MRLEVISPSSVRDGTSDRFTFEVTYTLSVTNVDEVVFTRKELAIKARFYNSIIYLYTVTQ